jgi:hypothetical protein
VHGVTAPADGDVIALRLERGGRAVPRAEGHHRIEEAAHAGVRARDDRVDLRLLLRDLSVLRSQDGRLRGDLEEVPRVADAGLPLERELADLTAQDEVQLRPEKAVLGRAMDATELPVAQVDGADVQVGAARRRRVDFGVVALTPGVPLPGLSWTTPPE